MKIKILTYNILNGFCPQEQLFKIQKDRLKKAVQIIRKENPDILVLLEAYFWSFAKQTKNFGKFLENMYRLQVPAEHNFRWAPVILSKFTIKNEDSSLSRHYLNFFNKKRVLN